MVASATQFNAVGAPVTTKERFVETLTNAGPGPVTVHLSSRALSPYTTVCVEDADLTNAGKYSDRGQIHVARRQARLNVSVALFGVVNLSLIAPNGELAEYNLPQGVSNFGECPGG